MNLSTRFKLLLAAILIVGALVAWPLMHRTMAINNCLARGGVWSYSTNRCE